MNKQKQLKAIDLLLLDLSTVHPSIRSEAKENECEEELNRFQQELIDHLKFIRIKTMAA